VFEDFAWHSLTTEDVFKKTGSSDKGLNSNESKKRLKKYGINVLQTKTSETIARILLRQLKNPLVYVLLLSTLLAFSLKKVIDGSVILCVVILNTVIGFIQEYRANRIIRALSALMPHKATVLRDGDRKLIPTSHLVPGDVVFLQAGDRVPADMRLFSLKNLQCDESALTGESLPVAKRIDTLPIATSVAERKCMVFSGTHVTAGMCTGVIVATGLKTEFGRISELIEHVISLETPLSISLKKIARGITVAVLIMGICLFIIGYLRGGSLFDSGLAAVALAVATIPEGLPAVLTIASAIGVRRMARKQAIIRQLPAVEALGSTTIICTDKTGTLTHNEMTVQRIWTNSGFSFVTGSGFALEGHIIPQKGVKKQAIQEEVIPLLRTAILCNDATLDQSEIGWVPVGDPTEVALVVAGRKANLDEDNLRLKWERKDVIPFESERRLMATLNTSPEAKHYIFLKGAPEEILLRCNTDEATKVKLLRKIDEMAMDGMRVLAFAEKELKGTHLHMLREDELRGGFVFLGFIGMIDPPRKEVYRAIKSCHEAGIKVKMITGDYPITAQAIGRDLGLLAVNQEIITGEQLNRLAPNQWQEVAVKYNVFARVSPEHKLKLVMALQKQGHVIAMTGDGVNDAPALKRADIGIAMGIKGTAVAREASDMILVDDNFASIEAAVEEGRRVYDNLVKSLAFILPTSLGQAFIILIAILSFPIQGGAFLHPMRPVQILWVNLVVAVALALPLAFEIQEPDIMKRPPRKKTAPVLSGFVLFRTITVSLLMALSTIGLFLWEYHLEISKGVAEKVAISEAQTMAVTTMMLFQVFYLFHCRSFNLPVFRISFFSNPHLLIGVAFVLLAQFAFVYAPIMNRFFYSSDLDPMAWLVSLGVALIIFVFTTLENAVRSIRKRAS
jgi:magnesium-transporting ATPase (P-type)